MRTLAAWPIYIYFGMVLFSRLLFRHRECVRAASRGPVGWSRLQGVLLCLGPLALMQLAPFAEYWLRYRGVIGPGRGSDDFFALVGPANMASGAALFAAGVLLAGRASRQLAAAWRETPGQLCTAGIYSLVRHPLYAGYLVQGAGCMLTLGSRWSWIGYGLAAVLILLRIWLEDRELAGRFPESADYFRRVKRLVPGVF
jgi:protein-S-isoprenylcysteine O-methyltransferase Ste14